ncbi:MAG: hypothetical protein IMF12_04600 [Proteobacteria bacterium]|nr:hypothetical protein [Pseudomonadota bacterium]
MFRFIILILCMNVAHAADMVIVHSNVPQYVEGQLLDSQTSIFDLLVPASEITVVFSNGGVKTINGPYRGTITDTNKPDLLITLSKLLTENKSIIRGSSKYPKNLWLVDVNTSKRFFCVAPASRVVLWRPKSQSASTLTIKHKASNKKAVVKWPAKQTTLRWPSNLPIVYGDSYTLELKNRNGSFFKILVLYQLPDSLPTTSHKVVWMVGRGCISQANKLLSSLR